MVIRLLGGSTVWVSRKEKRISCELFFYIRPGLYHSKTSEQLIVCFKIHRVTLALSLDFWTTMKNGKELSACATGFPLNILLEFMQLSCLIAAFQTHQNYCSTTRTSSFRTFGRETVETLMSKSFFKVTFRLSIMFWKRFRSFWHMTRFGLHDYQLPTSPPAREPLLIVHEELPEEIEHELLLE